MNILTQITEKFKFLSSKGKAQSRIEMPNAG